jgi:membrane fusion protein, macrolide-specific efflux system
MDWRGKKGVGNSMKASGITRALFLFLVLAMAATVSGCQLILPKDEEPLAPPLDIPNDIVYQTLDVTRGDILYAVEGMARVESGSMADVYFEAASGRIKSINVKVGDKVKKGDVLLELKTDDLEYQLKVAQLRLQALQNTYDGTKKRMNKTNLKNAEIELKIARLGVQQLEQQKANSILKAPISGQVVYVTQVGRGGVVDAYSTLVRIADESSKILEYQNVMENQAYQIGADVQVSLNTDMSKAAGKVVATPFTISQLDLKENMKMVYIKVPDAFLKNAKIGDSAMIAIIISERKGVLILPRNAVKNFQSRRYVDVLVNNIKEERDVQVGLQTPAEVEIVSGIEEGEKVIVGN